MKIYKVSSGDVYDGEHSYKLFKKESSAEKYLNELVDSYNNMNDCNMIVEYFGRERAFTHKGSYFSVTEDYVWED